MYSDVRMALILLAWLVVSCGASRNPAQTIDPKPLAPMPSATSTPNMAVPPPDPYSAAPPTPLPESFEELLRKGTDLCAARQYLEALPHLRKAETLSPDDPEVNLWLFIAYKETELFSDKNSPSYQHAKKVVKLYGKKSPRAKRAREFIEAVNSGEMESQNEQLKNLGVIGKFRGISVILVGEDFKRFYTEEDITLGVFDISGEPYPIVMTGSMAAVIPLDEFRSGWMEAVQLQAERLAGRAPASPSPDDEEEIDPNEPLVVRTMTDQFENREVGLALLSTDERLPNGGIYVYIQDRRNPIQGVVIQPHEVSKFTTLITEIEDRSAKIVARSAAEEKARREKYQAGYTAGRKSQKAGQSISQDVYSRYFDGDPYARGFHDGWFDAF